MFLNPAFILKTHHPKRLRVSPELYADGVKIIDNKHISYASEKVKAPCAGVEAVISSMVHFDPEGVV